MKMKYVVGVSLVVASVVLAGAVRSARAADEWFVLGEQVLDSKNPSVEIKAEGNRWERNIKKVKLSAEGADVQVEKVALRWAMAKDEDVWNVGTIKAGGQTAAKDAPGLKGRLQSVMVQYTILHDKPSAKLKIWGYD
jgi:hypothetical protein